MVVRQVLTIVKQIVKKKKVSVSYLVLATDM